MAFSKRSFRKELNVLTTKAKQNGYLGLLKASVSKTTKAISKKPDSDDDGEATDESVHVLSMDQRIPRKDSKPAALP